MLGYTHGECLFLSMLRCKSKFEINEQCILLENIPILPMLLGARLDEYVIMCWTLCCHTKTNYTDMDMFA